MSKEEELSLFSVTSIKKVAYFFPLLLLIKHGRYLERLARVAN